uniref:Uncharacterized protein n=1 Tax=uncultured marine virus TaxID=186617 RepID=A0A0F7L7J4_9VIRU|nr:hypothetical protein [uncultured marine virus]
MLHTTDVFHVEQITPLRFTRRLKERNSLSKTTTAEKLTQCLGTSTSAQLNKLR